MEINKFVPQSFIKKCRDLFLDKYQKELEYSYEKKEYFRWPVFIKSKNKPTWELIINATNLQIKTLRSFPFGTVTCELKHDDLFNSRGQECYTGILADERKESDGLQIRIILYPSNDRNRIDGCVQEKKFLFYVDNFDFYLSVNPAEISIAIHALSA